MENNNILNNQISNLLEKSISSGEIKVLTPKDIPLLVQIASTLPLLENTLDNNPEMIFVAAPTGAGKDTLVRKITSHTPDKEYVILNMDMFRHYYPSIEPEKEVHDKNFALETNEISYEIYYLIEELILNYYNNTHVILTGTIKDTPWIENILQKYKKNNYNISISALAVPYLESAFSIFERYLHLVDAEQESNDDFPIRFTSLSYHDQTFEAFSSSLNHFETSMQNNPNKLLDSISVYKRDKSMEDLSEDTLLYSSTTNSETTATNVVNSILNSSHSIDCNRFSNLLNLVKKHANYLKNQDLYLEIIESLKKIYQLDERNQKPLFENISQDIIEFE